MRFHFIWIVKKTIICSVYTTESLFSNNRSKISYFDEILTSFKKNMIKVLSINFFNFYHEFEYEMFVYVSNF